MSYELEAVRDKPVGLWMLDSTIPFQEYSGSNRSGTATGTVNTALSLVNGALYSSVFNNQVVASFDAPVFQQGFEDRPFSLEAWVRPVQKTTGYVAQPYRENLITNPSIEVSLGGWSQATGATVVRGTTRAVIGSASIDVTTTGISGQGVYQPSPKIYIEEGQKYTLSGWAYFPTAVPQISATMRWQDINTNTIGIDATNTIQNPATGSWVRISVTSTAPAGAVSVSPMFRIYAAHTALTFQVDGILLEKSATLNPYFDGSMPGYEWSGTVNSSISRVTASAGRVNWHPNPSYETDTSSLVINGASNSGTRSTTKSFAGLASCYVVPGNENWGYYNGLNYLGRGRTYTLSVWVNSDSDQTLQLIDYGSSPKNGPSILCKAGVWTRLTLSLSLTDNHSTCFISVRVPGRATMATPFYMDAWLWEETTNINDFFDGNSDGSYWVGTTNNSASIMRISESEIQILGNTGQYDGLVINGTKVAFTTKYLTTGEARAEYDLQILRAVHVVGVHSSNKNSLYVDGILVIETDISDIQKADKFVVTDGKLYSGQTISSKNLMVNAMAAYQYALSPDSVSRHFSVGRTVVGNASSVPFGGQVIPFSKDPSTILFERQWSSGSDWNSATLSGVSVDNDQLVPQIINDVSMPGCWTDSCDLYDGATPNPVNAVNMMWDGEGAIVQASVDGITWETVTRGQNLSSIPAGFDPTGKELYIRVTFPGGITDDTSYLDNLVVTGFNANTPNVGSFQVVYNQPAYIKENREPVAMDDSWGTEFRRGSAVISPVIGDDTIQPQTIEVWFKVLDPNVDTRFIDLRTTGDTSQPLVALQYSIPSIGGSGFTLYRNGVLNKYGATATLPSIGQWEVWHFVATGPIVNPILVNKIFSNPTQYSANVSIGQVVLYEAALSATDVSNIVSSYTGVPALRVGDASIIGVSESPSSANIYAHDWSIEASG